MAHSLLKCTNAECSRTDVCDCFPCTNDAQSLLCDLCYRCLGSFSITDKRLDLRLEMFKSVSLSLSLSCCDTLKWISILLANSGLMVSHDLIGYFPL